MIYHKVLTDNSRKERVKQMDEVRDRIDLGTWGAFRTGWWVLHVVGIVVVGYIGYWIATM